MKTICLLATLAIAAPCWAAEPPESFYHALASVESGGRSNAVGDNGKAIGPYQIHRAYFLDSGVAGSYSLVTNEPFARRVVIGYMKRYQPKAFANGDLETLARTHNGGPGGAKMKATLGYWKKVKAKL